MAITIYQNVHMHETNILVYILAWGGGSKFIVGSASLDPTLVMRMTQPQPLDGGGAPICSLGEPDHILQIRCL